MVIPLEADHLQITLIDPALPLHDLMKIAITNRPELASNRAVRGGGCDSYQQKKRCARYCRS